MVREANAFIESWNAWHAQRLANVTEPHGPAALTLTYWVKPGRVHSIPGVPGEWRAIDRGITGTGVVAGASGSAGRGVVEVHDGATRGATLSNQTTNGRIELTLDGVSEVRDGDRLLRLFERDGVFALRILDPSAPERTTLRGIDAYDPDPDWSVAAKFEAHTESRVIELVDGYRSMVETSGTLVFDVDGTEHRLTATRHPDRLSVVFGDTTNGAETYGFRFLSTELPDDDGGVTLDFNRAFLPPCAFSTQFVCPLPTPENRLPIAIRAGERELTR